jgi:transmembrane protein 222
MPVASTCSSAAVATPIARKSLSEKLEQESPLMMSYPAEMETDNRQQQRSSSSHQNNLAFTIVWSPLPPITWLIPFIGHTGICDSQGIASDFQGPYHVGDDGRMAFGPPTRSLKIPIPQSIRPPPLSNLASTGNTNTTSTTSTTANTSSGNGNGNMTAVSSSTSLAVAAAAERWDQAIQNANEEYRGRMHNICADNCHSHVAYALNRMPVAAYGVEQWNMVRIAALMFFRARFVSYWAIAAQFLPFTIMVVLIVYFQS